MVFIRPLLRYTDFSGRARRSEYWGFVLFEMGIAGLFLGLATLSLGQADRGQGAMGFFTCLALGGLVSVALLVPHLAVTVRRLHDTDRSAWWLLLQAPSAVAPLVLITTLVGVAAGGAKGTSGIDTALASAAGGGVLLLLLAQVCNTILLVLLWMRGTDGENRFGADPRSPDGRLYAGRDIDGGGLNEARLDALFAQARQASMDGAASARSAWPEPSATTGFGRRGA